MIIRMLLSVGTPEWSFPIGAVYNVPGAHVTEAVALNWITRGLAEEVPAGTTTPGQKGDKGDPGTPGPPGMDGVALGIPGPPGRTPIKDVDYFDGQDGLTPVKGVDYFDGVKGDPGDPANIAAHESAYDHALLHSNSFDHVAHSDDQDLSEKVDKETGKGLSANDFTSALKSKLDGIAAGAVADHADIANKGTNTHAQIDAFIGTKAQASGLASLDADSNVVQGATLAKGGIVYAALDAGTLALTFGKNSCVKVTPTATGTFTTTVPAAGVHCWLIILTTGTTSRTMTFGTGFKSTGTLATGTTSGRTFVVHFISDGTNVIESGRTGAMA